jgi:hypothetical protein
MLPANSWEPILIFLGVSLNSDVHVIAMLAIRRDTRSTIGKKARKAGLTSSGTMFMSRLMSL